MDIDSKFHYATKSRMWWFTLVELIVVISILVILWTIGFSSVGEYTTSSRDSQRLSNLDSIAKGLDIFGALHSIYPLPDNPIQITNSGALVLQQWTMGTQAASLIKVSSNSLVDPTDKMPFTYSVGINQKKYQILGFLENSVAEQDSTPLFQPSISYAANTSYYPVTKGHEIGILLDATNFLPVDRRGLNIDIATMTWAYRAVINDGDYIEWSGSKLVSLSYLQKVSKYDSSLIGYWDMETMFSGALADLSGNGNVGIPFWGITIGWVAWKFGAATYSATSILGWQYVQVSASSWPASLTQDTSSLAFWFKYSAGDCLYCSFATNMNYWNNGYMIQREWTGSKIYERIDTSSGSNQTGWFINALDTNWHHFAYIIDKWVRRAYMDGALYYSGTYLYGSGFTTKNNTYFFTPSAAEFQISMDEIRFYKRALSSSEIKNLVEKNRTD